MNMNRERTSCESNGLIPDFISMFARTKYFRHAKRLTRGGREGGRKERKRNKRGRDGEPDIVREREKIEEEDTKGGR